MPKQGVEIDLRYVGGGKKALRKMRPELYRPLVSKALGFAATIGQKAAQSSFDSASPVVRSIRVDLQPMQARVFSAMSKKRIQSIEIGRRPGEPLQHPDALRPWMERTGFPESVWILARAIRQRGVKGRFFMKKSRAVTESGLFGIVKKLARTIEVEFARSK